MTHSKSMFPTTVAITVALMSSVPRLAVAQSKDSLGIADNDSIYVDGQSFKIVPGRSKGNASALIKKLDARNLGPGTIIFRAGDKLYIADAPPVVLSAAGSAEQRRYGSDRDTGGTDAQAERDWQDSQRLLNRRYGSDRDTSGTVAPAERDVQDSPRLPR